MLLERDRVTHWFDVAHIVPSRSLFYSLSHLLPISSVFSSPLLFSPLIHSRLPTNISIWKNVTSDDVLDDDLGKSGCSVTSLLLSLCHVPIVQYSFDSNLKILRVLIPLQDPWNQMRNLWVAIRVRSPWVARKAQRAPRAWAVKKVSFAITVLSDFWYWKWFGCSQCPVDTWQSMLPT